MNVDLKVERKGYVSGEKIFVTGEIQNNTNRRMKSVELVLVQVGKILLTLP